MVRGTTSRMFLNSTKQRDSHTHTHTHCIDAGLQLWRIWCCLLCSTGGVWWSSLCTGADVHPLRNQTAVLREPLQHWPRVHRYRLFTRDTSNMAPGPQIQSFPGLSCIRKIPRCLDRAPRLSKLSDRCTTFCLATTITTAAAVCTLHAGSASEGRPL